MRSLSACGVLVWGWGWEGDLRLGGGRGGGRGGGGGEDGGKGMREEGGREGGTYHCYKGGFEGRGDRDGGLWGLVKVRVMGLAVKSTEENCVGVLKAGAQMGLVYTRTSAGLMECFDLQNHEYTPATLKSRLYVYISATMLLPLLTLRRT